MGNAYTIQEIIKAVEQLNEDGRYVALQAINALAQHGYKKEPTGYFHGIEKKGNILYPAWGYATPSTSGAIKSL